MELKLKRVESPFVFKLKNTSGNECLMDANPTIGGKEAGFRPMELLAGGLAGCVSIDVINILKKKRIQLGCYEVAINAVRSEEVPSPFEAIELEFIFYNKIDEKLVRSVIELALNKYCSVAASLNKNISISYKLTFVE